MARFLMLAALALMAFIATPVVMADDTPSVKLDFTAYDSMTVKDCLRVVSMETGEVVLPDDSVRGFVGAINVTEPDVPSVLNALKTYEPGLTYQIVYYPNNGNEPDGEELYQDIQQIKAFTIAGLILPASGDDNTMVTFSSVPYTTPDVQKKAVTGMREIYLVSDPTVRAQMNKPAAAQQQSATAPLIPGNRPTNFTVTLNALVQQIAHMTPDQQTSAMVALANAQKQINMSLDPSVMTNLRNGYIPRHPGAIQAPGTAGQAGTMLGQ
jgi:hypothetical protein